MRRTSTRVGAGLKSDPEYDPPWVIRALIGPPIISDIPWPKSSKTIAREKAKMAEAERLAAEAAKLQAMVLKSLKPQPGRLWSLHPDALLLIGPAGGIAVPASAVSVLAPLAAGGRHALEASDRATLDALAPRLAVVGLRVDRRRTGWRIAKTKPDMLRPTAA